MSFQNSELRIVDIDLEHDDRVESRNSSQNSVGDDAFSHYSYTDSDLHDFQKMEKDIYGSHGDDESSQEHDMLHEYLEDATDEQTESLEFVRPHVPVRPSLGDPIDTYDQLQCNYEQMDHLVIPDKQSVESHGYLKNKQKTNANQNVMSPPHKSRTSSRASGGSAETVLSQSQHIDELPSLLIVPEKALKSRVMRSSISSAESADKSSRKRTSNRATLKSLLDQEKATRKSQETYIDHLQQSLNQLLSQHALAKETIDQLRLGINLNIDDSDSRPKLRRPRYQKRPSTTTNSQILSRRYSSIIGGSDMPEFMNRSNNMSRAKSVDMGIFDEEPTNENTEQHTPINEFGGSLKYVKNESPTNQGLSRDIANDFQLNFDKFQTRVEIIEQAIEELSSYIDGGASGSSGSQYGELDGSNDRHQADTENRLQNILLAYDNLQKDFNQVCSVWKDTAKNYIPASKAIHNMDTTEQIEGSLFQLRMQLDDLERHVKQGQQQALISNTSTPLINLTKNQNLVKRLVTLEDGYRQLMGRYNDLKRLSSPSRQKDMEDIIQQLKSVVAEANGRSANIMTPENLENMLHQDLIESMKRHLSSDSPPYFLTEEDGLSSANSSFGKGKTRRKKSHRLEDSIDWKSQPEERLSPIKSRISPRSMDNKSVPSQFNNLSKYDSQPVSVVSSNSAWHGAASGETLIVDENGVFREPFRNGSKSINDIVSKSTNKNSVPLQKARSFTNSVELESGRSRPNSSGLQNLEDDVKRLDEHLARIELEEKNRPPEHIINRDSDAAGSRNTRSLLGTSPSNSNYSRQSKPPSSVGSGHRRQKIKQPDPVDSGHHSVRNRKKRNSYQPPIDSTDSGEESASYDNDLADYVRNASCGIGPRSRYIRKKNDDVQDRWSQTPLRSVYKPSRADSYGEDLSPEYDDAYIDDVAYWDGVAFHPAREGLPSKSILRRSVPRSKHHGKRSHKIPKPPRPYSESFIGTPSFPVSSRIPYNDSPSLREYASIGPHRYFVREYGNINRMPVNQPPMLEEYEDEYEEAEVDDDEDEIREYPRRKYVEERRLCNYLDEAIKAAKDMRQYTKRLTDICEQRQFGRNSVNSFQNRSIRPMYT